MIPADSFHIAVHESVQRPGAPVTAITAITLPRQVELRPPEREQRLFTPVLNVIVREDDQGLSADQMHVLRSFLERTLEDKTRSLQTEGRRRADVGQTSG